MRYRFTGAMAAIAMAAVAALTVMPTAGQAPAGQAPVRLLDLHDPALPATARLAPDQRSASRLVRPPPPSLSPPSHL